METQTVTIEVDQSAAAIIRALQEQAEAQGVTLTTLLLPLAEGLSGREAKATAMTPEERARAFKKWVTDHSVSGVIADDSRDSIYTREDDAL